MVISRQWQPERVSVEEISKQNLTRRLEGTW